MRCPVGRATPDYPFSSGLGLKLDPEYVRLREECPVVRVAMPFGGEAWLVTRYAHVRQALLDPRFSMNAAADWDVPRAAPRPADSFGLMGSPPEQHARLRKLLAMAFTARRVEQMRPHVEQIAGQLVEDMVAGGSPANFVDCLALPLPITVICQMLGVPAADHHVFGRFSDALVSTDRFTEEEVDAAVEGFTGYLRDIVGQRRERPEDDLASAFTRLHDDGSLTEAELHMLIGGLLVGGYETTANELVAQVLTLLADRSRYERLVAQPELIPSAVEELLRWVPLWESVSTSRVATEDVELGGVTIRKGDAVVYSLNSANRDPQKFPDADLVVLDREHNAHLAFNLGPHYCVGAPLARLELQCALAALIHRLPGLRLVVDPKDVVWRGGMLLRGTDSLMVAW